jgi:hypothetical protein
MRIGASPAETRRLWAAMPPLASSAVLGGPRPGATVLAVTTAPSGAVHPLVAVQRYGSGRSMIFAGEGSWRWRMLMPAADRSYEYFWRQTARWLTSAAPDPVSITVPDSSEPGDALRVALDVRDGEFGPVADADVAIDVTLPGGESRALQPRHDPGTAGRFLATLTLDQAGLYRVRAQARDGGRTLGDAERWLFVGGGSREFTEPRLNDAFLRRTARASGGEYVPASEAAGIPSLLQTVALDRFDPERRDLWHEPWAFALVILLLSTEWVLRRRWGLR